MRCYWERLGVLGPIYRLLGRGLTDREIADQLKLTEVTVHSCIAWLQHFLHCDDRAGLVFYSDSAAPERWGMRAA
jgi:DNA-binding NarL/FixJ family response regulator